MIYWQLFWSFMQIGLFSFGGGLVVLSMIQNIVVSQGWITQAQFVDIVAISQMTPGPIGINCATYVGYTATGSVWGSVVATGAIILPSIIIMGAVCALYWRLNTRYAENRYFQTTLLFMRWMVLGMIGAAALSLMTEESFIDSVSWIIYAVVLGLALLPMVVKNENATGRFLHRLSHPIVLIILSGAAGWVLYH